MTRICTEGDQIFIYILGLLKNKTKNAYLVYETLSLVKNPEYGNEGECAYYGQQRNREIATEYQERGGGDADYGTKQQNGNGNEEVIRR